ncbi:MAG: DUF1674 domain-containing protein [Gammaproteobacteria bacterium]
MTKQDTHRRMDNSEKKPPQPFAPVKQENGRPKEIGGPGGPEPTRYGDWERRGRCIDF